MCLYTAMVVLAIGRSLSSLPQRLTKLLQLKCIYRPQVVATVTGAPLD